MSSTNGNVIDKEVYPTPADAVAALMGVLNINPTDRFLEPCKGDGAIYDAVPLPTAQKEWAEIRLGRDYLATNWGEKFDLIITNPPFSLTEQFLEKSMSELAPWGTLIYLQRVNFFGSIKRVPFIARIGFPNKTPVIIPRPRFAKGGTDSCEYAWMVWDRGGRFNVPNGISHLLTRAA